MAERKWRPRHRRNEGVQPSLEVIKQVESLAVDVMRYGLTTQEAKCIFQASSIPQDGVKSIDMGIPREEAAEWMQQRGFR
jgi:hypothetical protein